MCMYTHIYIYIVESRVQWAQVHVSVVYSPPPHTPVCIYIYIVYIHIYIYTVYTHIYIYTYTHTRVSHN